ncbi:MAG: hypothetical protein H6831_03815 [Planctomycetes bacterium]|nr:hypothetical protein [Planctomycetota bacterium]
MRRPFRSNLALLATLLIAAPSLATETAQDSLERIAVEVTSSNGPVLVVNRGASSGIRKGDSVVIRRIGLPDVVGTVTRVEKNECFVELEDLDLEVGAAVGLPGEVLVPQGRAIPDGAASDVPEHPPWQEPVDGWAPGRPLLAPATSPEAEDRPAELDGRLYTRAQYTDDRLGDRTYARFWTGVDLDWSNPFEQGGEIRFKGDVSYRDYMTGSNTADETLTRIQRLSYTLGGRYGDQNRVEFGRFLSTVFPQFGLIDGVEYIRRFEGGSQLGGSVGFLPDYTDDLAATDDLSTAIFYRWVESPAEKVALSIGYQKTWHAGTADRDLLASNAQWIISPDTSLRASVLVDYYDGTAQLESKGFELTELHASLNQRLGSGAGAGLYVSYLDWPELLKDEFPTPLPSTIADQKVKRGGANAWTRVADGVTLYGRFDLWTDDANSGNFADLRADLRDVLYQGSNFSVGAYQTQASFSDGIGGRVLHTHWFGQNSLRLGYDAVQYTQDGFIGGQSRLLQRRIALGLDSRLTDDVDLTADAEQRFGDEQDAYTLGLRINWRF